MSDPVREGYLLAADRFGSALGSGAPLVAGCYSVAGRPVRLRVVGRALAERFVQPWSHLEERGTARGSGALTVDLWHRAETRIEEPDTAGDIDPFSRFPLRVSRDDRFLVVRQPETVTWLDRETGHLVGAIGDVERRTLYEAGRPVETPLLVWLRDQGVPLVHASFVARGNRGVLIVGRSGSGKSTLAAQCLCAGFDFLGDDKVAFVSSSGGHPMGYSLNSSLHLDSTALSRLPLLAEHAVPPSLSIDDKYRVAVERVAADRLRRSAPIRMLLMPTLEPRARSRTEPASKKDALLALSLSTLLALPIARDRSLDHLAELAESLPAYRLDLIPEPDAPGRVAALIDDIGRD
jgi:hypothetical protein